MVFIFAFTLFPVEATLHHDQTRKCKILHKNTSNECQGIRNGQCVSICLMLITHICNVTTESFNQKMNLLEMRTKTISTIFPLLISNNNKDTLQCLKWFGIFVGRIESRLSSLTTKTNGCISEVFDIKYTHKYQIWSAFLWCLSRAHSLSLSLRVHHTNVVLCSAFVAPDKTKEMHFYPVLLAWEITLTTI